MNTAKFSSLFINFLLIANLFLSIPSNRAVVLEEADYSKKILQKGSRASSAGQFLIGHTSEVWDVEFSPDGHLLASVSSDNSIIIWNTTTGSIHQNLTGHQDSVYTVTFHPHDPIIASGSFDRSILIWNLTTGEIMQNLRGHTASIWSLDFSPDGTYLASGSGDSTVRIWDYRTSESFFNATGHTEAVRSVHFLPNGLLASGSYDNSILLWNLTGKTLETVLSNNTDNILTLAANPSENILVSGSQDNLMEFWDLTQFGVRSRAAITTIDWIRGLAFSHNGYYLASGLQNGNISIWEGKSGFHVKTLTGHAQSVRGVDFHPTKPLLASASGDHTVRLWNVTDLDNDQVPDFWELENGLSPQDADDMSNDPDDDGLVNILEYKFGTNPHLADSDLDQISDYYEFIYGMNGSLDDANGDIDNDGMSNLYEFQNNLNSAINDTMMDADNDGMPNLYEYLNGLEAGKDDANDDLDNDGLPNIFEFRYDFVIGIDDGEDDADSDGLSNREEFLLGTNPRDPDSDNDFFNDGLEKMFGTDPNNFFLNPITILFGIILVISCILLIIIGLIKSYPRIKVKSSEISKEIQVRTKDTIEYFRPKPHQTWIRDLQMGKAIHLDSLTSELETSKIKLPKAIKESLRPQDLIKHSLVQRSDMILLQSIPPKDANCQVCIGEIHDEQYFQCESCKRFVCISDYVDLVTVDSNNCPNCSGGLVIFPFSCKGCGIDYSSVIELSGKSGCPICGYTLTDQQKLIDNVTADIQPSKISKSLQRDNMLKREQEDKKIK